ncbi:MAG: hypothetical protein U5R06_24500 [candidate division KSB1 bacterium]|nr:hypothetical protein [candidate division KSB1 bacterium]
MAEVKLENLIEKLRKEGVEDAQKQSDEIIKKAEKEAKEIVENAQKKADEIVKNGQKEAEKFQQNAEQSIKQAARDSELMLKEIESQKCLMPVFKREVSDSLDAEFLKDLIAKIIEKWSDQPEIEVQVSDDDKKKLEDLLFKSLKKDVKEGVTLSTGRDISEGFRIGMKDENVYFDFSDETLADFLKSFLNERLNEILDNS